MLPNMGSTQEVAVDYSSATAESITGGLNINMIPKTGGNRYSGSLFATAVNSSFEGTNTDDRDDQQQQDRLTEAYLQAILSLAEYQRRRRELEQQRQTLATQAQQLDAQVDRRAEVTGLLTSIEAFCQRAREGLATASFAQKRTLVELLIDRVLVTNSAVEIRYVFPTHPRSEKTRFCHLRKDYFNDVV